MTLRPSALSLFLQRMAGIQDAVVNNPIGYAARNAVMSFPLSPALRDAEKLLVATGMYERADDDPHQTPVVAREVVTPAAAGSAAPTVDLGRLERWARGHLKKTQQRVVLLLCQNGGECPLADLAVDLDIGWPVPYDNAFNQVRGRLNAKLKKADPPCRLARFNNRAKLFPLGRK